MKLIDWVLTNIYLLIVVGICLVALLVTLYNVKVYEDSCNLHWEEQYCDLAEHFGQKCYAEYTTPRGFNQSMNFTVPGLDIKIAEIN